MSRRERRPRRAEARSGEQREGGFSLLEVLIATTLLAVGVLALAQLFDVGVSSMRNARATTMSTLLAEQKMEQLRALTWAFDALGVPVSDAATDTAQVPEAPAGGTGLTPSPESSLDENTAGYVDFLDAYGRPILVAAGTTDVPEPAVYIRRWSVAPLPSNPENTLVLQVLVTRHKNRDTADRTAYRLEDEARILAVKTRKAP